VERRSTPQEFLPIAGERRIRLFRGRLFRGQIAQPPSKAPYIPKLGMCSGDDRGANQNSVVSTSTGRCFYASGSSLPRMIGRYSETVG
jgi:hypothetical protein